LTIFYQNTRLIDGINHIFSDEGFYEKRDEQKIRSGGPARSEDAAINPYTIIAGLLRFPIPYAQHVF
jgi:hypothetical protein